MDIELLKQGLLIAAIGMGLVFAVIIFLWGLMALLMRVTSGERRSASKPQATGEIKTDQATDYEIAEGQRRAAAAAIAVELALASQQVKKFSQTEGEGWGEVSPWQAFHRLLQIKPREK